MATDQDSNFSDYEVLNGLMGRTLKDWHLGDGGMHFSLDDGRVVIFSGTFAIAVLRAEEPCLH